MKTSSVIISFVILVGFSFVGCGSSGDEEKFIGIWLVKEDEIPRLVIESSGEFLSIRHANGTEATGIYEDGLLKVKGTVESTITYDEENDELIAEGKRLVRAENSFGNTFVGSYIGSSGTRITIFRDEDDGVLRVKYQRNESAPVQEGWLNKSDPALEAFMNRPDTEDYFYTTIRNERGFEESGSIKRRGPKVIELKCFGRVEQLTIEK